MKQPFSNRLSGESSPYLLQHAHNPVDWYPWGPEALEKAKKENKPILVSIGYAACHWCHVMERESFEDEATARIMNEHFINIKIDREERPDLDHIYMDAVQAMTGSGGWPLNVFLTPGALPFYGGTYFPPRRSHNRASWQETLHGVIQAFGERRHEIDAQAENLTDHLKMSSSFGMQSPDEPGELFRQDKITDCFRQLMKTADRQWGGFGRAPKFPQTFSIQFLLRYHHFTGDPEALDQALLSLDKMAGGGIYDQVGGGFARYSTDAEWLAPHFEKMLYDNALLVSVYSEAYQLTGQERHLEVIEETLAFVQRELMHPAGGFYSALDADSEGVEGKFYTWSLAETAEILGEEAALFSAFYDITAGGNWEHTNIAWVKKPLEDFAAERKLDPLLLKELLKRGRSLLLEARNKRVRPQTDDKIILGWNALMNTAISKACEASGNPAYRQLAIRNMEFLLQAFAGTGGRYYHTWKEGRARYPAFLDDLAFLIQALLKLQEITGDRDWLEKAREICQHVVDHFGGEGSPFFYYTPEGQEDIIVRKKEMYDGALPSGNSVMAANLYQIGILLDVKEWVERCEEMLRRLGNAITRYPGSFAGWAMQLQEQVTGTNEILLAGDNLLLTRTDILKKYIPNKVLLNPEKQAPGRPMPGQKKGSGGPAIYLCRNNTCLAPVFSAEELISLINRAQKQ
ncbi:MAG: thioredoxin domain-containing protein [Sphingobacteriales bacterium]|nr:thioredoxin domain-containing protein [Sphingobacteriales bacterium]